MHGYAGFPKGLFFGTCTLVSGAGKSSVGPTSLWEVVNSTGFGTGPNWLCIPSLPSPSCVTLAEDVIPLSLGFLW